LRRAQAVVLGFAVALGGCGSDVVLGRLPTSSVAVGGAGGGGGSAAGGAGGGGGCGVAPYPPGPYGIEEGDVVDGALSWQGLLEGAAGGPDTVTPADFYEPRACRGAPAVVFLEVNWASGSDSVSQFFKMQSQNLWMGQVRVLELVTVAKDGSAATFADAAAWRDEKGSPFAVAADPGLTFLTGTRAQAPLLVLVRACPMTIARRIPLPPPMGVEIPKEIAALIDDGCPD
jgi:hypothetical protein